MALVGTRKASTGESTTESSETNSIDEWQPYKAAASATMRDIQLGDDWVTATVFGFGVDPDEFMASFGELCHCYQRMPISQQKEETNDDNYTYDKSFEELQNYHGSDDHWRDVFRYLVDYDGSRATIEQMSIDERGDLQRLMADNVDCAQMLTDCFGDSTTIDWRLLLQFFGEVAEEHAKTIVEALHWE